MNQNEEHKNGAAAGPPEDPRPTLEVSDDKMEATLLLRGSRRHAILPEEVIDLLDAHGIIYGVDITGIKRQVGEYNQRYEKQPNMDILCARGTPPEPGRDGKIEILIEPPPPVSFDDHGRADYRNIQKFRTVDKGQVVARRIPPIPGKPGMNIFGEDAEPEPPADPQLNCGPNIRLNSATNEYAAIVRGIFINDKERIDVNPVLTVPANVGLDSGNVTYDGNVKIGNTIERAALVSATGDVEVGGMIESGNVRVGGSLTVHKGINTRREGMINVNGNCYSTYIDNSNLTVAGSIIVFKSVIASHIICYGDMTLSGKGSTLSGGELHLFGSLSADTVGNRTGIVTRIYLGVHEKYMQYYKVHVKELEHAEKDFEKLRDDVLKIKNYITRARGKIPVEKQAQFRQIYKKYKEQVELRERLQQQVTQFRENRYNNNEVRLIVRDTILPGAEIHYRNFVEKITAPQTKVVFRFFPGQEKPGMEAYRGQ
ncbi:MAG: DUF342 domain-containing protein [Leptospiraceae bacterium]|nr:DUF342 domain-containing protein [Leptospiraceae bacterium]